MTWFTTADQKYKFSLQQRKAESTTTYSTMNNLNVSDHLNIKPEQRGAGDKDGWKNYALLLPMICVGVHWWFWERRFLKKENEYHIHLTEKNRQIKQIKTECQKKLRENECQIKQFREQQDAMRLEQKEIMEDERQWQSKIALLNEVKEKLLDRQSMYCSHCTFRSHRYNLEKKLLEKAVTDPRAKSLQMEAGLKDIFKRDKYCAGLQNKDKTKNGSMLWLYLETWYNRANEQKRFKEGKCSSTGASV